MKKYVKWLLYSVAAFVILFLIWNYKAVQYGISQGYGQFKVLYGAQPLEEVLNNPDTPDSIKAKIKLIQEIKQFTVHTIGLNPSGSYNTFYDQKGKPILWVVTGSKPFELKAYEWDFPIVGRFSYKGFFEYGKALKEEKFVKSLGYDTGIDPVSAWSTLGWLDDPILSEMLKRKPGSLANLIIHELTHGTLYIKNNVQYNENLANFVGDQGALIFLEKKYGKDSKEYLEYTESKKKTEEFTKTVLNGAKELDSLYTSFDFKDASDNHKIIQKRQAIGKIVFALQQIRPDIDLGKVNNTFFLDFLRYEQNQGDFEKEFEEKFHRNFKAYMNYLKDKYPSL